MGQDMKMVKETSGPKKASVVVKKSALEEFLEEWGFWREKKKAKKAEKADYRPTDEELFGDQRDIVNAIKKKRKKQTNFMDSGFMLIIKMFVGITEFIATAFMWACSFMFSFKGIAIIAAIVYFSGFDMTKIVSDHVKEEVKIQAIELTDDAKAKVKELKAEHGEEASDTFNLFKNKLESFADGFEGLEINIKRTDGTTINIGGGDADESTGVLKSDE